MSKRDQALKQSRECGRFSVKSTAWRASYFEVPWDEADEAYENACENAEAACDEARVPRQARIDAFNEGAKAGREEKMTTLVVLVRKTPGTIKLIRDTYNSLQSSMFDPDLPEEKAERVAHQAAVEGVWCLIADRFKKQMDEEEWGEKEIDALITEVGV